MKQLSLYIHIPFCTRKCDYCHFYVVPNKEPLKDQLMKGLYLEWSSYSELFHNVTVPSVYFGGGTPALLGADKIKTILDWLRDRSLLNADTEITLEANPENITYDLMKAYYDAGVNRVSIGIQSLDDNLLKVLTRTHDANKAIQAIFDTKRAGFNNISIDLMYDLPYQKPETWKETVMQIKDLPISHLSIYNLTIEPFTVYFKKQEQIKLVLPNPEQSLEMYEMAGSLLDGYGLKQYEISAFARDNCISIHNTGYWTGRDFVGMGPSAFSYIQGKRFHNVAQLSTYVAALEEKRTPVDFEETLEAKARQRELLAINLRMIAGCDLPSFQVKNGEFDKDLLNDIVKLVKEGFLERDGSVLRTTRRGVIFYDHVATELI